MAQTDSKIPTHPRRGGESSLRVAKWGQSGSGVGSCRTKHLRWDPLGKNSQTSGGMHTTPEAGLSHQEKFLGPDEGRRQTINYEVHQLWLSAADANRIVSLENSWDQPLQKSGQHRIGPRIMPLLNYLELPVLTQMLSWRLIGGGNGALLWVIQVETKLPQRTDSLKITGLNKCPHHSPLPLPPMHTHTRTPARTHCYPEERELVTNIRPVTEKPRRHIFSTSLNEKWIQHIFSIS